MQLAKDACACGHPLENHDGGRGAPCNYCACSAGEPPTAFEVGIIHSIHELTLTMVRLVKEVQSMKGGPS